MPVINHTYTKVLIIGVSEFPEDETINAIPNVLANVELLKSSLINPELIGIPESNITVSINEDKGQIERKLLSLVNSTRDKRSTLVIYYSGHGILSSNDFKLYLTTHRTSKAYLEIDGVHIDVFKNYIKRSRADRKIVILDCCHSGAFIDYSMGSLESQIQADINEFTGTYIMTSAAGDEPSLYPVKSPDQPTYFTGKLVEIINEGLDIDRQFCSLRDIYDKIEDDFRDIGLPHPQQSNVNDADQLLFAVNRKFHQKKPADEQAWDHAVAENSKWAYIDFKKAFPDSPFVTQAMSRILEIEDEEYWTKAIKRGTLYAFVGYLDDFPNGKHTDEANQKISELRSSELNQEENRVWNAAITSGDLASFQNYLNRYPNGKFLDQCKEEINKINARSQYRPVEPQGPVTPPEQQYKTQGKEAGKTQVKVLETDKPSAKELETQKLREQEMLAYERKEKELAAQRKETERLKELELQAKEAEKKRIDLERQEAEKKRIDLERQEAEKKKQELEEQEAERKKVELRRQEAQKIKEQKLEAERIESLRLKAIEEEKLAEQRKQNELEAERIEKERLKAAALEKKRIEAQLQKEKEAEKKSRELEQQKKAEQASPKHFMIQEEVYNEKKTTYSREVLMLIAAIVIVISIMVYIIMQNI